LDLLGHLLEDKKLKRDLKAVLKRLSPNADAAALALTQFSQDYAGQRGEFNSAEFKAAAQNDSIAPHIVWDMYGDDVPELQHVAVSPGTTPASS
jgi:hypothetical protein